MAVAAQSIARIQRLPVHLANQIAAGEVVERPASVLKELLENSLDAGADRIDAYLEQGGQTLVRVTDNGMGIVRDDILMALDRHATSKISEFSDMSTLHTLGFRGEALPSIASVSRFSLTTRRYGDDLAWQVMNREDGSYSDVMPAAHPQGTTVEVHDLFYNTPARKQFLRKTRTELLHCLQVFNRIALSRPDVVMRLFHNNRKQLHYAANTGGDLLAARIQAVCGNRFRGNARQIEKQLPGMQLGGWITTNDDARNQSDMQYLFVNGRMVRDRLLLHAVRKAYQNHMYHDRHPGCVLYLEVDTHDVDVNVHPTKHEVRFQQARQVHDFIYSAVVEALTQTYPVSDREDRNKHLSVAFHDHRIRQAPASYFKADQSEQTATSEVKVAGVIEARYLLYQDRGKHFLLDIMTAFENIFRYRISQESNAKRWHTQPLLLPISLSVNEQTLSALLSQQAVLSECGIVFDQQSPTRVVFRELPRVLRGVDAGGFCQALPGVVAQHSNTDWPDYLPVLASQSLKPVQSTQAMQECLHEFMQLAPDIRQRVCRELDAATLDRLFNADS